MAGQKFNREQIQRCVDMLDTLAKSGQSPQVFAQDQGLNYNQVRGWLTHGPRWRAELAGVPYGAPLRSGSQAGGFIQANLSLEHRSKAGKQPPNTTSTQATPSVQIICTQGQRSATVNWPTDAPLECAQWLKAYLA